MDNLNILMTRINNLKKLKAEVEQSYNPNPKYIESLNWAIKICEKEVSKKIAQKEKMCRW